MKRFSAVLLTGVLAASLLAGCASKPATTEPPAPTPEPAVTEQPATTPEAPQAEGAYKDGTYYAEEKGFDEKSGWKNTVDITVTGGKIVEVAWNGVHKDGGDDKETQSKDGRYDLTKAGGKAAWHEQAAMAEAFLIETQDPTAITYTDDEGHTDAVAGASITVKEFFVLAEEASAGAK